MILTMDEFSTQWKHIDPDDYSRYGVNQLNIELPNYTVYRTTLVHPAFPRNTNLVLVIADDEINGTIIQAFELVPDHETFKWLKLCQSNSVSDCIRSINDVLMTRFLVDIDLIW